MDCSNLSGYRLLKPVQLPLRREPGRLALFAESRALSLGGIKPKLATGDGQLVLMPGFHLVMFRGSLRAAEPRDVRLRFVLADDPRHVAPSATIRAAGKPVEFSTWGAVTVSGTGPVALSLWGELVDAGVPAFVDQTTVSFADMELLAISFI